MKKVLCTVFIIALCFLVSCGSSIDPSENMLNEEQGGSEEQGNSMDAYTIFVNEVEIAEKAIYNDEKGLLEIPVLAVLKELGAMVTWTSSTEVTIVYGEQVFILNTKDETMKQGDTNVLVADVAGGLYTPIFRANGEEVFIDGLQLGYFFQHHIGTPMTWSHDLKQVYIKEGNHW